MNFKRLNNLYYIKREIKEIENELKEINNLGSAVIDDMPKGNKVGNPTESYTFKRDALLQKMNNKIERYLEEYEKINGFINTIDDVEIRLIARLRFMSHKDWQYIAAEISPDDKYIHWTTPRKKLKRWMDQNKR